MKTRSELIEWGRRDLSGLADYCFSLQNEVSLLKQQQALTSRNSSKPPSQDGYCKPKPKSLRTRSGKKSGGQPGHPGHTLIPVENPDHVFVHFLKDCPCGCGSDLRNQPVLRHETRQVFDLPPQKLEVTEHRAEVKRCPRSGREVCAQWPKEVTAPVQYGARFHAWLTYCNVQQLLPLDRIGQMSDDLFGHYVSAATIYAALHSADQALTAFQTAVVQQIKQVPVAHADESGVRVMGTLHWLHSISTETLTWYGIHHKRGKEAIDFFGILPAYHGRLIHDCFQSYFDLPCDHGLCNAHILRELTFLHEELQQPWAGALHKLLIEMNDEVNDYKTLYASGLPFARQNHYCRRYRKHLRQGRAANPPLRLVAVTKKRGRRKQTKTQNLLDRMERYEKEVLAFLFDFRVPFTNNLAEQDIRMIKVRQKISGAFRTLTGAQTFATIRSYCSTVRKCGQHIFPALVSAIEGNPFIPVFHTG